MTFTQVTELCHVTVVYDIIASIMKLFVHYSANHWIKCVVALSFFLLGCCRVFYGCNNSIVQTESETMRGFGYETILAQPGCAMKSIC